MYGTVAAHTRIPEQRADPEGASGASEVDTVDRPWRRALKGAVVFFLISRVGLLAVTLFTWFGEPSPKVTGPKGVFHVWTWEADALWYIQIAQRGYPAHSPGAAHAAFFPLYPFVTRAVAPLFLFHYAVAAVAVANLALLGALVVLYRLTEHEFGPDSAGRTLFYLLAFPTGFFLGMAYNESMSIGLTVAALYAMRRGHWWWAGVAGLVAATARSAGILLVAAFVFEYLRQHRRHVRLDALAVLLIPVGLGAVAVLDQVVYHDPLAFSHAQAQWGREAAWPWQSIVDAVVRVVAPGQIPLFSQIWTHNLLELSTVVLLLVLTVLMLVGPWRVRPDQVVLPLFGLVLILFMISFPTTFTDQIPYPLVSTSRMGLEVFPAFMMLGKLGQSRVGDRVLVMLLLPLQGLLLATLLHGGWVA